MVRVNASSTATNKRLHHDDEILDLLTTMGTKTGGQGLYSQKKRVGGEVRPATSASTHTVTVSPPTSTLTPAIFSEHPDVDPTGSGGSEAVEGDLQNPYYKHLAGRKTVITTQTPHSAYLDEFSDMDHTISISRDDHAHMAVSTLQQQQQHNLQPRPQVGSEDWHRQRRDNHKQVERRRRETINEGINDLARIIPGCEGNKGSILQCAVNYIQDIKTKETYSLEKWSMERMLLEQANSDLKNANERLRAEVERWKRQAETLQRQQRQQQQQQQQQQQRPRHAADAAPTGPSKGLTSPGK